MEREREERRRERERVVFVKNAILARHLWLKQYPKTSSLLKQFKNKNSVPVRHTHTHTQNVETFFLVESPQLFS